MKLTRNISLLLNFELSGSLFVDKKFSTTKMSSQTRRSCKISPNKFCYICGEFLVKSQARPFSENVKKAYFLYFGVLIGDQDKQWAPHMCCVSCSVSLVQWMKGKRKSMPFAVPMVWREPTNHFDDCYFCLTKTEGYSKKEKRKIEYPNLPSAIRPVPHNADLPVPIAPLDWQDVALGDYGGNNASSDSSEEQCTDPTFTPGPSSGEPHLIVQSELNDLVRDLGLSKQQSELLGSRLKEWNLLAKETKN